MNIQNFIRDLELVDDSPNTVRAYAYDITKFQEFLEKEYQKTPEYEPIEEDVKNYLHFLKKKGLNGSTISRRYAAIARYFKLHRRLSELEFVSKNLVPKPKLHEASYLTLEQVKAIFDLCDRLIQNSSGYDQIVHVRNKVIIYTFIISGMRRGELLNLTNEDIDLKNKTLRLERLKQKDKPRSGWIPLTDDDCALYKAWLTIKPESQWLFPGRDPEKPLSGPSAWSIVSKLGKMVGIKVWPHEYRHTVATLMLESGETMEGIANFLGHKSVDTTRNIYASVTPNTAANQMNKYRNFLSKKNDELNDS